MTSNVTSKRSRIEEHDGIKGLYVSRSGVFYRPRPGLCNTKYPSYCTLNQPGNNVCGNLRAELNMLICTQGWTSLEVWRFKL